jgi:DNA repair protein RAD50
MESKRRELQTVHQQMEAVTQETDRMRAELDRLNLRKGQAVALQEQLLQQREQQWRAVTDLVRKLPCLAQVTITGTGWNAAVIQEVVKQLQYEYQRFQQESGRDIGRLRDAYQTLEKTVHEKRGHIQALEVEMKLKTEEIRALQQESNQKRIELSRVATSRGNIQLCQVDYDSALQVHQEFMNDYSRKLEDIKRQVKETTDRIRDLQDEIAQDALLLQELGHHRNEIAAAEASIQQADGDIRLAQSELASLLATSRESIIDVIPGDAASYRTTVELESALKSLEHKTVQVQQQRDFAREEISRLRSELAAKEAVINQHTHKLQDLRGRIEGLSSVEHERDQLIQRLNELRRNRALIGSELDMVPNAVTFEELILRAKETEDEAREMLTITKASKAFLKRMNKERKRNPGACPCCGQGMTPSVVSIYESNVSQLLKFGDEPDDGAEVTLEEYASALEAASALFVQLQTMQKRLMPAMEIRTEIGHLERLVQELHLEKRNRQAELAQWEGDRWHECETKVLTIGRIHRAFQDICLRWKNADQRRLEYTERKRRQTDSLLSGHSLGTRSLDDIEALQRQRLETKDALQVKKDKLVMEETSLTKRFYAVKQQLAEAEKILTDAKFEGSRYEELEMALQQFQMKVTDIEGRRHVLQRDRDNADRDMHEFQVQVTAKQQELRQSEDEHQRHEQSLRREQEQLQSSLHTLDALEQRLQQDPLMQLSTIEATIAQSQSEIAAKEDDKQRLLLPRIQALSAEVASQEHVKRNVLGNIELRATISEAQRLRDEWQRLQEQQQNSGGGGGGGGGTSQQQLQQAEQDQAAALCEKLSLTSERDTLRGRVDVYRVNVQQIERRLQESSYRNIEERYRRKNIEFETTNMAVIDLDNYLNALDRALQSFHTMKIRSINKIIRELWQQIYQGQDIDTIEIESGADMGDGADALVPMAAGAAAHAAGNATGTGVTSRSYNYRVVMKKGDLPLDMRGRCSAGQKVLAAIVIRLALAETFCTNCGILALDEPTTNLDEPNKAGLAQALARLIAARAGQQNFQLLCITHDEDFVRMMRNELALTSDANLPAYYFRVYRQEKGHTGKFFSHIDRIPWEDM